MRPLLFRLEAEAAHEEAAGLMAWISACPGAARLAAALAPSYPPISLFGLRFPSPVGLAAGFDKDGRLAFALPALGFGFVEIGTVTLEPQEGNPRPRLFRLPESRALLNRMGFNGLGAREVARLLDARPRPSVPLGVNIGLNRGVSAEDAPAAYERAARLLAPRADYLAVNVSSPNTPGLRGLQAAAPLAELLERVAAAAAGRPVLLKLSPDLPDAELDGALSAAEGRAAGLILANTTVSREGLAARWASEAGGLSGEPLRERALALLRRARARTDLPIVSCGGAGTGADLRRRLEAGASLVQLYTALVYGGPGTARRMAREAA